MPPGLRCPGVCQSPAAAGKPPCGRCLTGTQPPGLVLVTRVAAPGLAGAKKGISGVPLGTGPDTCLCPRDQRLSPAAFAPGRAPAGSQPPERDERPNRLDGAPGGGRVPRVLPEGMLQTAAGMLGAAGPRLRQAQGSLWQLSAVGTCSPLQPLRVRATSVNVPSPGSQARPTPARSGPCGASVSHQQPRGCRSATARGRAAPLRRGQAPQEHLEVSKTSKCRKHGGSSAQTPAEEITQA